MSETSSRPHGLHTLNPHIVCADCAGAIEFYKQAFGATEEMRMQAPNGKLMHAAMLFGDSMLLMMDEVPEWGARGPKTLGGTPVTMHMISDDPDAVFERAVAAGATVVMPLKVQFWGDYYGVLEDPYGHSWSVSKPGKPLPMDQILENMKTMMPA